MAEDYRSAVDDALCRLGEQFADIDWTTTEIKGRLRDPGTEPRHLLAYRLR